MDGPSLPKKGRDDPCCIIHCSDDDTPLISPQTLESWETLKRAAQIRKHAYIIERLQSTSSDEIPQDIFYHRKCRSLFTMKRDLEKIANQNQSEVESGEGGSQRRVSSRSSSPTVPEKVCIFCKKETKYFKSTRTREPLTLAQQLRADDAVKTAAELKNDSEMLLLLTRDVVATQAHWHRSCYRLYTKEVAASTSADRKDSDQYEDVESEAYHKLFDYIRNNLFVNKSVIQMTELSSMLISWMKDLGINEIKPSTTKHMRRKISKEFGDSIHFTQTEWQNLLVYPDSVTLDELVGRFHSLKTKVDTLKESISGKTETVNKAADDLREVVKQQFTAQEWPPHPSSLTLDKVEIPELLSTFLQRLLNGKDLSDPPTKVKWLTRSIAQDIIFGISKGRYKPAKHVLLPAAVKTFTGNVELVKILNRLGHGVSYTQYEEIETSLCLQKLAITPEMGIPLPNNIHAHINTTLAFDNIDRLEGTLSGGGTSHRVNGIAVQPVMYGPHPPRILPELEKNKQRSIKVTEELLPVYNVGQRAGPPPRKVIEIDHVTLSHEMRRKNLLFILARLHCSQNQKVFSWTGFNLKVHAKESITNSNIGYLPTINAPATSLSTVYEMLNQTLCVMQKLHLTEIACVLDQAIYSKATEIKWGDLEKFKPIVLRLGTFHTVCTLLSIIGKRFEDAGLKDVCIESGCIAEGSVSSVFEGKNYNRGIRFHKLAYESFMRVAWSGFRPWLQTLHGDMEHHLDEALDAVNFFVQNINTSTHEQVMELEAYHQVTGLFSEYLDHLRKENGPLSSFWVSYMDMVELLLNFVRASREGNWMLHLSSVRQMLPWCFAYDAVNYSRYMSIYYSDMMSLPEEHPLVYDFMQAGGFSVQLGSENPFGRIPVDQALEETVNKDTQTPGGTKGFSLKPGAVQRYYLTAEYRTSFLRNLREMVGFGKGRLDHPDLHPSRVKKDEEDVASMVDLIANSWTNPFDKGSQPLTNLSTGAVAPTDVAKDIATAQQVGEVCYQSFKDRLEQKRPKLKFHDAIKKNKLKTFSTMSATKKVQKSQDEEILLRTDRRLFARMIIIAQSRKLQMQDVLKHPLGPLPSALATTSGLLRKTNKAQLGKQLEKLVQPENTEIPRPSACLIDGMAVVQKLKVDNQTFGEIADIALKRVLHEGMGSLRIDVVFDVYKDLSIKSAERLYRGQGSSLQFSNLASGHKIKQFKSFLQNGNNKNNLIKFFVERWSTEENLSKLNDKVLYVTTGTSCFKLSSGGVDKVNELTSSQEEADTRLIFHAKHAAGEHCQGLIISSEDTDVKVLCLAFNNLIESPIFQRSVVQGAARYTDIRKLARAVGDDVCKALLGLHAFTGCDTVSAFAGIGKVKPLKMVRANREYQLMFQQLGNEWTLSDELFLQLQSFVCALYNARSVVKNVNECRYAIFCAKNGEAESHQLPPCEDCLRKHSERANFQTAVWKNAIRNGDVPSPVGEGWSLNSEEETLEIDWMDGMPAPRSILELIACACKKECKNDSCVCILNGLKCSDLCKPQDCTNQIQEEPPSTSLDNSSDDEEL